MPRDPITLPPDVAQWLLEFARYRYRGDVAATLTDLLREAMTRQAHPPGSAEPTGGLWAGLEDEVRRAPRSA